MTPTAGPPPGVLEEINALFSWNPPRLIHKKPSTASTATHLPSFYDKHFSSGFVLKRVVHLPSLVQDLAKNVDKALDVALTTLPSLNGLLTAETRAVAMQNLNEVVTGENGVANVYSQTTATYCLPVASTLALYPSASFSKWRSLLSWTQACPSSGYATMNGRLCFIGECLNQTKNIQRAAIMETMENKNHRIFEEMGKSMEALATWEIKSPSACPAEVMAAVLNLDKFSWTACTAPRCLSNLKHRKARENVERVVVGPDAQASPWNFPDYPLNTSLVPENRNEEIALANLQRPLTRRVTRSAASASSTLPPHPSRSSGYRSPTEDKGKKRKRDDDEHDKTAQSLVQQAWAQAVRVDGTVVILHSGNHELVCVRHRGSQTLYVSDVIEPPTCVEPGYGKLHIGIYVAAVQDTMDRKQQQLSQPKPPRDGGDLIGGKNQDHNRGVASPSDESDKLQKTIYVASNRNVVLLYLQYDVYDSQHPASFLRSCPSIMTPTKYSTPPFSPRAIHTCGIEECLTIVLTSEIGRGATGVVHRGTLEPEICDGAMPLDVVVKLVFGIEQRNALKGEYEAYHLLRSKGVLQGIATVLGLFDDCEDGACALVMLYAGVPLVTEPEHILSISDCNSALSTLESIHRAGILHGDIRQDNILMGDSGVTIIDFGHSKRCDNQKAKDKELAQLRHLLGLKGTSECSVANPLT